MWWKFYFWFYIVLTIVSLLWFYGLTETVTLGDLLSIMISVLAAIGLYGYVFNKKTFPSKLWKIIFWVLILGLVYGILSFTALKDTISLPEILYTTLPEISFGGYLFGTLITLPAYFAIYKLGQGKTLRKKEES